MKKEILSKSPEKTIQLGERLGSLMKGGEVLGLVGELGVGKTTFVKGVAQGLGVPKKYPVNSPTFVLLRQYEGRIPLYHFDAHRLVTEMDLLRLEQEIGIEDYLFGKGVSVFEWANQVQSLLPREYLRIEFNHLKEKERVLSFEPIGTRYQKFMKALHTV